MPGRIIEKIDEIGRKTYELKQKENAFYAEVKEESRHTEIVGTDKLREMVYEKFEPEWKKIDEGKEEVDWMIYRLCTVEDEEKIKQNKIKII